MADTYLADGHTAADIDRVINAVTPEFVQQVNANTAKIAINQTILAGLINGDFSKNLLPVNSASFTATESAKWYEIQLQQPIPKGKYVLSFGSISSTDTDSTTCRIMFFSANWTDTLTDIQVERGENLTQEITFAKDCTIIRFCAASTATGGVDDTLTFTDAMICDKGIYDITAKYVPYSPTYQELVARVAALETANASAQADGNEVASE